MTQAEITDVAVDEEGVKETPVFNKEGLETLGSTLARLFSSYEADRKNAEQQWLKNMRQKKGVYDPNIEKLIGTKRSKAYPRITRVKCVGMLSKLMNLMFPVSDKNWTVEPSPVPDLSQDDLQTVLDELNNEMEPGSPIDDQKVESAIRAFAKERSKNLELLIDDQLQELGGSRLVSYSFLARKVMQSGIDYGLGVLHGPFVEEQQLRTWKQDFDGKLIAVPVTSYRPRFEFVPIWDYYPDLSATYFHQMKGQFQRKVLSRHELIELKQRSDVILDQIDKVLERLPTGNYKKREYESQMNVMGKQSNVSDDSRKDKYELLMWDGYVSAKDLIAAGVTVRDDRKNSDVRAQIWMIDGTVIKAKMDPWTDLLSEGESISMYHHFIFEEDEANLMGIGLPEIMRDSQMGICDATRMVLDNGSVHRNLEVNTSLLRADQYDLTIGSDKVWYREDDSPSTINSPAVRVIDLPMHLTEMQAIVEMFKTFADQETFVTVGTDFQNGPSEPFRTAAGASMLKGDAALPFKDVVRNFDVFTESVIGSIIKFNHAMNDQDESIRGDFRPAARGATSLIAKEVLGIQLDNLAATLTDDEKPYIRHRELALARVRVRDLETADVVVSEEEAKVIDKNIADANALAQQQQTETIKAGIRETLSSAFKNVSLANKNAAAAEAQTAKVILDAMEVGLNATDITGATKREGAVGATPEQSGVPPDQNTVGSVETAVGGPERTASAMPAGPIS